MAYIYLHRRNDTGEVFYVGKGTGKRAWKKQDRNEHWHRVVNKAGYTVEIIAKGLTDAEAYWVEPLLIEAYGGPTKLTNVHDGGGGWTSAEVSEWLHEKWQDPAYREKISKTVKEAWQDPEYRALCVWTSERCKESWQNDDRRRKMAEWSKRLWQDPEHRKKISESRKGPDPTVRCDKCGRVVGIRQLKSHQRGKRCYNPVT